MAKMVTRSIIGTEIKAKVVNKNTDEVTTYAAVVSKSVNEEKAATKELAGVIPEELVIIKIESMTRVEKLYGVDLQQFMDIAIELDPETRKPLHSPTDEN